MLTSGVPGVFLGPGIATKPNPIPRLHAYAMRITQLYHAADEDCFNHRQVSLYLRQLPSPTSPNSSFFKQASRNSLQIPLWRYSTPL